MSLIQRLGSYPALPNRLSHQDKQTINRALKAWCQKQIASKKPLPKTAKEYAKAIDLGIDFVNVFERECGRIKRPSQVHIKKGDSLSSIAKDKYGHPSFWRLIHLENRQIKDPNTIYPYSLTQRPLKMPSLWVPDEISHMSSNDNTPKTLSTLKIDACKAKWTIWDKKTTLESIPGASLNVIIKGQFNAALPKDLKLENGKNLKLSLPSGWEQQMLQHIKSLEQDVVKQLNTSGMMESMTHKTKSFFVNLVRGKQSVSTNMPMLNLKANVNLNGKMVALSLGLDIKLELTFSSGKLLLELGKKLGWKFIERTVKNELTVAARAGIATLGTAGIVGSVVATTTVKIVEIMIVGSKIALAVMAAVGLGFAIYDTVKIFAQDSNDIKKAIGGIGLSKQFGFKQLEIGCHWD